MKFTVDCEKLSNGTTWAIKEAILKTLRDQATDISESLPYYTYDTAAERDMRGWRDAAVKQITEINKQYRDMEEAEIKKKKDRLKDSLNNRKSKE